MLACLVLAVMNPTDIVVRDVRLQLLGPTLLRLEQRGPMGFEDRETFTVVDRSRAPVVFLREERDGCVLISTDRYQVSIPLEGEGLVGCQVLDPAGEVLFEAQATRPLPAFIPAPGEEIGAFVVADGPRIVPPPWGATPAPADSELAETSGWDLANDALDLYVFVPGADGYRRLREDFLRLTGPVPMPPLYAFGLIDSRYHAYSEESALEVIDTYRRKSIPLDMFVVDTDWRVNASHGYAIETKYFPDVRRFLEHAKRRNVRIMFNDHPEPQGTAATDPKELAFRWDGLTTLLGMGVDVWWYDRNWHTHLQEPLPGLRKEVWGQRLFHDITARFRPERRPLIMSNVEGIDNGVRRYAPHPAGHRFPIWWTGDTGAKWNYLRLGVENGVDSGVLAMLPYVHEDLGGHWATPSPELYVRFLQFGCLSPIARVHCTKGETRYPWAFGEEAEAIATEYVRLRYRLLPVIYAAARRAFEDGTPILRRCDLEWPEHTEAADGTQYMLGDDLLVAPVLESRWGEAEPVPTDALRHADGAGLRAEYFDNPNLDGEPVVVRVDDEVRFDWKEGSPDPRIPVDGFSARWTGTITPPASGAYEVIVRPDDGARLWLDGELVIDSWQPQFFPELVARVALTAGRAHEVRLEYYEERGGAGVFLEWRRPDQVKPVALRTLWLPPGEWEDVWTGQRFAGPASLTVDSPLWHLPLFVRVGGAVITAPLMQHTSERPWDPIGVHLFAPLGSAEATRTLYEDDGVSVEYLRDGYAKTDVRARYEENAVEVEIGARVGSFAGAPGERAWDVVLHLPKESRPTRAIVDGAEVAIGEASDERASATWERAKAGAAWVAPFGPGFAASRAAGGGAVVVRLASEVVGKARRVRIEFDRD